MNLVSAENISRNYGERVLFSGLNMGIEQGQKLALIGLNGSGKTSLLRILAGIEPPDTGRVSFRKGLKLAYLPQNPALPADWTVRDAVLHADLPAAKLVKAYETLTALPQLNQEQQQQLSLLLTEMDATDAWTYERQVGEVLSRLDVDMPDAKIETLSGGQVRRVALAQALLGDPELLILDEPTNHLDVSSIEWLENYLATAKQSILLVTHDRYFLDNVSNEILELDQGRIFYYQGDYAYFLEKKAEREVLEDRSRERAQSLFENELDWLRSSPKARTTKSRARIDRALALGERARQFRDKRQVALWVKGRRIGGKIMEIKKLRKAYGDKLLVRDFTYTFNPGDRIGIAGPNGCGKSTFLNMLMEREKPDNGKIRVGETIVFGYYEQQGMKFKPGQRVIEAVTEAAEVVEYTHSETISAAQLLEFFLFPHATHSKLVENLSGGERRRLHLLRILMLNPNFLILDEPTNDLDLLTLRKLEEFLMDYEGVLVVVSHDRYFMDRVIDHLFVFEGEGEIRDFPGSFSQYQQWLQNEQQKKLAAQQPQAAVRAPQAGAPARTREKKGLSFKEQREYEQLEAEINALEQRKVALNSLLESGETDFTKLTEWTSELQDIEKQLDDKTDRWLTLAEMLG